MPTIRYYEEVELIDAPERAEGNQRRYGKATLARRRFIQHARDLGLSLGAVREFLALSAELGNPCGTIDEIAEQHLLKVSDKIAKNQVQEH